MTIFHRIKSSSMPKDIQSPLTLISQTLKLHQQKQVMPLPALVVFEFKLLSK
jgi:hypothetical protein